MAQKINIDNREYDIAKLSDTAKNFFEQLRGLDMAINEKNNLSSVLLKAKKAYISDLKAEMLSQKAGFDFSD